jgi:hypothetical protein
METGIMYRFINSGVTYTVKSAGSQFATVSYPNGNQRRIALWKIRQWLNDGCLVRETTEAVCPECHNTGYVPESEDEVEPCCHPDCTVRAERDAKQGTWTVDLTPRRKPSKSEYRCLRCGCEIVGGANALGDDSAYCVACERHEAHPKDRLGLSEGRWRDLCEASWHGADGTARMLV